MEIVFHAHHAVISEHLRARAERAVQKAASRLRRAVDVTVRFEEDGPTRRVEIVLHAPKQRPVVAAGEARLFGPALSAAAARLQVQVAKLDPTRARARRAAGDGALAGSADGVVDGTLDGALDEPPAGLDLGNSGGEIGVADADTADAPARA